MSILRTLTEAEADLAAKDQLVMQVGEATHHLAVMLTAASEKFWSLPTDRLLAVLNADVLASAATLTANTDLGAAVNTSLDALGCERFPTRAPLSGRADITFDGEAFIWVAPAIVEPVTEPQP